MYELYPYFTNDGTVGLFSPQDDDIYHSTYGAVTESWQKFINPCHLREFLEIHDSVKILDICYGIGYNSKAAMNVFVENFLKEQKEKNKFGNFFTKNTKKNIEPHLNIAAIDTNNVAAKNVGGENSNFTKINDNYIKNFNKSNISYSAIDTDNKNKDFAAQKEALQDESSSTSDFNANLSQPNVSDNNTHRKSISIDAVDTDKILMQLSPFIKVNPKHYLPKIDLSLKKNELRIKFKTEDCNKKDKFLQIKKMQNNKHQRLKKELELKSEVSIIILEKLLESSKVDSKNKSVPHNIFGDEILQQILTQKRLIPFFDKYMLNIAKFYQNQRYKSSSNGFNSTFLHNIYYKYLSRSYKNAQKVLANAKVSLNFHAEDARSFVKATETKYDFIFLDAFSPAKSPVLWSVEFINELYSKLEDDGIIVTYSTSASIRNAFLKNGFFVGKTYDETLNKFVGTIAVKNEKLIEHKFNEQDVALINSRAGICYKDANLNLDNDIIIANRLEEFEHSNLVRSSEILKGNKNVKPL